MMATASDIECDSGRIHAMRRLGLERSVTVVGFDDLPTADLLEDVRRPVAMIPACARIASAAGRRSGAGPRPDLRRVGGSGGWTVP